MSPRARLLAALFLAVVAAACLRLGLWQRARLHERRAANAARAALRALPPVLLEASFGIPLDGRRVVARGAYDPAHEVVVRGRALRGSPGVEVFTPLRLTGRDTAILVRRGFLPAADAFSADFTGTEEPGEVTVTGFAEAPPPVEGPAEPLVRDGRTTWKRLDLAAIRAAVPYPLHGVVLLQLPDPALPRRPQRIDPPSVDDEGSHFSYMLQWWSFATIAVVGGALLLRRRPSVSAPGA
ncbi:MAG: SURF1 family protein [Gemmatimonadales bacterium]|nr:SURF1 family protein [Gemmatimonadales bacterium]